MARQKTIRGVKPLRKFDRQYTRDIESEVLRPAAERAHERVGAAGGNIYAIQLAVAGPQPDALNAMRIDKLARTHVEELDEYHRRVFITRFARGFATAVNLYDGIPHRVEMQRAIAQQIDLIKTIPRRYHAQLRSAFAELAKTDALDEQAIQRVLTDAYRGGRFNIERISRDQTSKQFGKMNELRQKAIGVDRYIWRTSLDERVRATHAQNDGGVFSWEAGPIGTGHPGHDILCRCIADAVISTGTSGR